MWYSYCDINNEVPCIWILMTTMAFLSESVIILLVLCIHGTLCHNYTGTIDTGRLRGVTSEHRVLEDFILVMNFPGGEHESRLTKFLQDMKRKHPASQHVDSYVIDRFVAVRVKLPEEEAKIVSEYPDIGFMQSNLKVTASQVSRTKWWRHRLTSWLRLDICGRSQGQ